MNDPGTFQDGASALWGCGLCGQQYVTQVDADRCAHRRDRIDYERPTEWWSARDEAILRGELAKLQSLPRPAYVERDRERLAYRPIVVLPRRVRVAREVGAWVALVGILALMLLLIWAAGDPPNDPPAPAVTPVTFALAAPTLVGSWSTP